MVLHRGTLVPPSFRYGFLLFLSFSISYLLTPFVAVAAERFGVVDVPNERKVHAAVTPLLGGVAIFIAFFLSSVFSFWYSFELHIRFVVEAAFIVAIAVIYLIRNKVTDIIEDERTAKITEQASLRTFQVFWVIFCAFSIGAVMQVLYVPTFPKENSGNFSAGHPHEVLGPRLMGYFQLTMLCLMIFLYVGFRIYYARKYGDWETDEE